MCQVKTGLKTCQLVALIFRKRKYARHQQNQQSPLQSDRAISTLHALRTHPYLILTPNPLNISRATLSSTCSFSLTTRSRTIHNRCYRQPRIDHENLTHINNRLSLSKIRNNSHLKEQRMPRKMSVDVFTTFRNTPHETIHAWIKISILKKSQSHGCQLPSLQNQSLDKYHGNQRLKYLANCRTPWNHPWNILSHLLKSQFVCNKYLKNLSFVLSKSIKSCPSEINYPLLPSDADEPHTWNTNLDILKTSPSSHPSLRTITPLHISPKIPPQLYLAIAKNKTNKLRNILHDSTLKITEIFQDILIKNSRSGTIRWLVLDICLSNK